MRVAIICLYLFRSWVSDTIAAFAQDILTGTHEVAGFDEAFARHEIINRIAEEG